MSSEKSPNLDNLAAVREDTARFHELVESIDGIVWELDLPDFRFTYVSPKAEQLLGYPISDWLHQEDFWQNHLHPDDREWAVSFCKTQTEALQDHEFEYRIQANDGRWLWIRDLVSVVTENNRPLKLRGVMIDVTRHKQTEMRLLETRDRLQLMIDRMPLGCIVWDNEFKVESWNPAAQKIFGFSAAQTVGKSPFGMFVDEKLREQLMEVWRRLMQGSLETNIINENLTGDGRRITCEWQNTPLRDETGRVIGALSMVQDISSRFQSEQALKESEAELRSSELHLRQVTQQFEALLQAIPDRIMIIDQKMQVAWINRNNPNENDLSGEMSSGTCCSNIDGLHCEHQTKRKTDPTHLCLVGRCFKEQTALEERSSTEEGQVFATRVFPIRDEQTDEMTHVIEINQDITDSVRLQEHSVRAGQLVALGELAAGVAHEINNPINGIINYAQILLNSSAEGSREQDISQRIQREADRIATIVKELLFFSRDGGQETVLVDLREALDETLTLARKQLEKEGVTLEIDIPAGIAPIPSHGHQVQQLILNLISNARHALAEKFPTRDPEKKLTISANQVHDGGRPRVRMLVRDQGAGIPKELLPKVLNPFVTTKPAGVGTGLGLSISHEIVRKHGGLIEISSEHGQYTQVMVEFPID